MDQTSSSCDDSDIFANSSTWFECLYYMSPIKRICVFEHSVMTNSNCACPAIQRDQGSGFLSEGSSCFTACMSEQRRFWRDCADAQARLDLRSRIGDKYQIRLTRSIFYSYCFFPCFLHLDDYKPSIMPTIFP